MPLAQWNAIHAELTQLRAMKAALEKLYAVPNRVEIVPSGDESKPQRTFITIYDEDYLSHEIVQEDGDTLFEAIEAALAGYKRLNESSDA